MNQHTHRRELCEVSRERVQQLNAVAPVEHKEEALMGGVEPMILEELRDLHLYTLTGTYIDEVAAKGTG
jgi:hypothetical protein